MESGGLLLLLLLGWHVGLGVWALCEPPLGSGRYAVTRAQKAPWQRGRHDRLLCGDCLGPSSQSPFMITFGWSGSWKADVHHSPDRAV